MSGDDPRRGLTDLIDHHAALIVELELVRQSKPKIPKTELTQLRIKELELCTTISAWPPGNRIEAYRKVEHVARILATGVALDRTTVAFVLRSVQPFFKE
ncbi:hypothetical protein QA648_22435 (plasmid) [Rhizobium sp. CB3171]|uniref:hypothetical protein n=1 Tax=Rhizobium sp. CB3171 TaxID=3039157 RepID=UPI0024B112FC|nr:hypothetical protein [Rhizobium sp. CB3171]WFU05915.1 hypothetical protein QA648_22435 [Rhizobium sp. CB3171]